MGTHTGRLCVTCVVMGMRDGFQRLRHSPSCRLVDPLISTIQKHRLETHVMIHFHCRQIEMAMRTFLFSSQENAENANDFVRIFYELVILLKRPFYVSPQNSCQQSTCANQSCLKTTMVADKAGRRTDVFAIQQLSKFEPVVIRTESGISLRTYHLQSLGLARRQNYHSSKFPSQCRLHPVSIDQIPRTASSAATQGRKDILRDSKNWA